MEALEKTRASVKDFLNVIFRRRFQILLFLILTFATVTVATLSAKPVYEASARILVKTGRESIYVPATDSGNLVININREEHRNSEVEILKSKSLAKEVVTMLGATSIYPALDRQDRGIPVSILPTGNSQPKSVEKARMALHKKLKIQGINKSNVIDVSFRHTDPQMAANVVNTLVNLYLVRHVNVHESSHSYKFFLKQSKLLKSKLAREEAKLEQLKQAPSFSELGEQQKILLQRIHDLRIALYELNKIEQSRISGSMGSQKMTGVSIIESAEVPLKPVSPKIFLNFILALFIGALGGPGMAFFLHFLDDSLESVEDVEDALGVPVLISIPYDKKEMS